MWDGESWVQAEYLYIEMWKIEERQALHWWEMEKPLAFV